MKKLYFVDLSSLFADLFVPVIVLVIILFLIKAYRGKKSFVDGRGNPITDPSILEKKFKDAHKTSPPY
jgi:hypothetical protein